MTDAGLEKYSVHDGHEYLMDPGRKVTPELCQEQGSLQTLRFAEISLDSEPF